MASLRGVAPSYPTWQLLSGGSPTPTSGFRTAGQATSGSAMAGFPGLERKFRRGRPRGKRVCLCRRKRRIAREVSKPPGSGGTLVRGQPAEGGHGGGGERARSEHRGGPGEWGGDRSCEGWGWGVRCEEALASPGDFGGREGREGGRAMTGGT